MNVKTPTDERQVGRVNDILQAQPEKPTASGGRKRYCVLYGCFMLLTAACRNMIC